MEDTDLTTLLTASLTRLAPGRGIVAAYLFGSQANGRARPDSDIDVAVLLEVGRESEPLELLKLGQDLERETRLANIDVRLLNEAPLSASGRILTEGRLLYSGDESARVDFEVKTRGLYFDFLPHLNYLRQAFIERTAEKGL